MLALAQAGLVVVAAWSGHWMFAGLAALAAFALSWWLGTLQSGTEHDRQNLAQRAQAEALDARSAEALVRDSLDAVDVPMFSIGPEGVVLVANRSASVFFGGSTIVGRSAEGLFESLEAVRVVRDAREGRSGVADISMLRDETRRVVRVSAQPAGNTVRAVVTLRDVTEEAKAQRLTTDFVANASHELRTPLAAIKGAAETLSGLTPEDGAMRDRLCQMVADNATRIEELTRDLLDLSRLESPERSALFIELDLEALARGVADHFSALSRERDVQICVDVSPEAVSTRSDPRLLGLVLRNLVDNALKYSKPGGEVLLACTRGGTGVVWRVSDQGVGIPLDEQPRIFERFYRVDQARTGAISGSGLGLALVKQAVHSLGGSVRVESVWTKGTTMTVELPDQPPGS